MRVRRLWVVGVCALMMIGGIVAGVNAEQLCLELGVITLEAPEGVEVQRVPVEFPHGRHFSLACTDCHHAWDGSEENLGCTTSGCHDLTEPPAGKKADKIMYFKQAFHQSCIGCHKADKAKALAHEKMMTAGNTEPPRTGPTGCLGCHPKAE